MIVNLNKTISYESMNLVVVVIFLSSLDKVVFISTIETENSYLTIIIIKI